MTATDWLQFVFTGVAGAFGMFCLFDGARRRAAYGPNASGRQMIGVGLLICLMLSGYAFWKHRALAEVGRAYQIEMSKELPEDWGKKMSPAKKEAQSLALARGIYIHSGLLREYVDAKGQRKRYLPNQADIQQREVTIAKAAQLQYDSRASFIEFVMWLVWGASALLFGLCFAREPAAKPADADAAPPP
jgi:hypothetical protein